MTQEEYVLFALSLAQKANSKDIKGNPFVGAIVVDENLVCCSSFPYLVIFSDALCLLFLLLVIYKIPQQ
jgi:hypothetical protein